MAETGKNIIGRFAVVYLLVVFLMILVVYNIVVIQTVERDNWLALGSKNDKKDMIVLPNRGNIYSSDGRLMASSIPTYYVYMDTRVPALHEKKGKLFYENVDTLAECLANYFGEKSKNQYKQEMQRAYNKGASEYQFYKKRITYSQLKDLKNFPLFKLGRNKSGLLTKEMFQRVKPFSTLASRTIGDIYADETKGGKNGLELAFDSILRGTVGVSSRQKIANRWEEIIEIPPVDGMDITTTIDVNMQDIAEKSLVDKLKELEAESGYAILMEAKTGEIKAIVNMQQNRDGSYSENRNGVVADKVEPGSVFKVMSLMAVLDQGKAHLNDMIETGNGTWKIAHSTMRDHNAHKGGYGTISLQHAINASSNVGVSKVIMKAYGDNPKEFVEKLYRMKINEPFQLYIPGSASPNIRYPNKNNWSATTLAWMSIGYETQIAPIYTVAYFNSIANNGKYLEPLLVKYISNNGQIIKTFSARVINEQICKPSTLEDVKKAILGVVEDPKYATGKLVRSPYVRIGGKTGTALISQGSSGYKSGKPEYQVSFCGIFPFDNPQYTCLVVIRKPKGIASGGGMAGPVVREIAERVIAINAYNTVETVAIDSTYLNYKIPNVKSGRYDALQNAMNPLKQKSIGAASKWVTTSCDGQNITTAPMKINTRIVPDFTGMGVKDAVYLCEKLGLIPNCLGMGEVHAQSIPAGNKIGEKQKIILNLQ
ncbi:MAG: penicillin-binding protein [Paludibacteraceae bacterium]